MHAPRAFTVIEILIVAVVVAILALGAVSDPASEGAEEAKCAAMVLQADILYARSLSIAQPDDPAVIKIDPAANCYWLARSSAPATPLTHPITGKPYRVQFGNTGRGEYQKVRLVGTDAVGAAIAFDATGCLTHDSPVVVQFSARGAEYELQVSPIAATSRTTDYFTKALGETAKIGKTMKNGM